MAPSRNMRTKFPHQPDKRHMTTQALIEALRAAAAAGDAKATWVLRLLGQHVKKLHWPGATRACTFNTAPDVAVLGMKSSAHPDHAEVEWVGGVLHTGAR